jgi:hypothetical protein
MAIIRMAGDTCALTPLIARSGFFRLAQARNPRQQLREQRPEQQDERQGRDCADVPDACAADSGANTPSMRPVGKLA